MLALAGWLMAVLGFSLTLIALRDRARRIEATARACHELRGPLTAARLGVSLGLRTGELAAERLRAIDLELDRAGRAIDDLADAGGAPVGVAPLLYEQVDIGELLADSVEAWRPAAERARRAIELSWRAGEVAVLGDRVRIAQATGNLIANAIEHGWGTVRVVAKLHHGQVRIEVMDRGPGLDAPLAQVMRGARRAGRGRGRGLSIAKAVVEAHGGTLASGPSELGARLVIELPLAVARDELQTPVA